MSIDHTSPSLAIGGLRQTFTFYPEERRSEISHSDHIVDGFDVLLAGLSRAIYICYLQHHLASTYVLLTLLKLIIDPVCLLRKRHSA